jgi:endonuclease/exonuclease/phosphatase family metal-dependent hydrolase
MRRRRVIPALAMSFSVAAAPLPGPPLGPAVLRIHDLTGGSAVSPYAGQRVIGVPGVVTAVTSGGFWFEDPRPDRADATSEGLFVGSARKVAVGDAVTASGRVAEVAAGDVGLARTELYADSVTVTAHGRRLPAPVVIGRAGRRAPAAVAPGVPAAALDPAHYALDFYRSLLGMRVAVDDAVAAGPRSAAGEVAVLPDRGAGIAARSQGGGVVARAGGADTQRLVFAGGALPAVSTGDHFPGRSSGILDYSGGAFKVLLTSLPPVAGDSPGRDTTRPANFRELAVATFDLQNLDPADPPAKYQGLALQIVDRLQSPDIIAVQEVEDNSGPQNDGTVAADQTVAQLVGAISTAGGPAYGWRSIDPQNNADGGATGANVRIGFLYRTDRGLSFVDRGSPTATAATAVTPAGLTLSPGRVAPLDPAWTAVRKPLAAEFRVHGRPLYVIANHWDSTGGDDPLYGRYEPPRAPSETQRVSEARVVAGFVRSIEAADPAAPVIVAGDLNDTDYSAALHALTDGTGLVDLPAQVPPARRYTAISGGESEVLDHILLNRALAAVPHDFQIVHVNADFADQVSDHDPSVVRLALG